MAMLDTFTTTEPMSVCYPRLNTTMPLEQVKVSHLGSALDAQSFDLSNKAEGLGLSSAVGFLLVEER